MSMSDSVLKLMWQRGDITLWGRDWRGRGEFGGNGGEGGKDGGSD